MAQAPDDRWRPTGLLGPRGIQRIPPAGNEEDGKDDEKKQIEEDTKADDAPPSPDYLIGTWLQSKGLPSSAEAVAFFQRMNITVIGDLVNADVTAIENIVREFPRFVTEGDTDNQRRAAISSELKRAIETLRQDYNTLLPQQEDAPSGPRNFVLGYLGLYKCVVIDYLWHKRLLQTPSKSVLTKPDSPSKVVVLAITVPDYPDASISGNECVITGTGKSEEALVAEYSAYKDLFSKMLTHGYIDERTLTGIGKKYRTYKYIYQNSRRDMDVVWLYFWGFRQQRSMDTKRKAEYFLEKNESDAKDKRHWIPLRIEKQGIWFDGFYYLFRQEIEGDQVIYDTLVVRETELIWYWMRSYQSRSEFFGLISKYGLRRSLRYLSIK